jgi:hypothetical protein
VGNLHDFPVSPEAKIMKIAIDGKISTVAGGLTLVLGVAFDSQGRLYALESSAAATDPKGPPVLPESGQVVRNGSNGGLETIATGLDLPTAITFGPDGRLYVSNHGYHLGPAPAGFGEIVRIDVNK